MILSLGGLGFGRYKSWVPHDRDLDLYYNSDEEEDTFFGIHATDVSKYYAILAVVV